MSKVKTIGIGSIVLTLMLSFVATGCVHYHGYPPAASPSSTAGDRKTSAGDRATPACDRTTSAGDRKTSADPAGAGKASSRQTGVSASSSGKTHAAKGQGGQTGGRPAAPSITAAGSTKIQETVKRPTPAYRTSAY
jgi:hypothetical protein